MRGNKSSFKRTGRQSSGVFPKSRELGSKRPARTVHSGTGWQRTSAKNRDEQRQTKGGRQGQFLLLRERHMQATLLNTPRSYEVDDDLHDSQSTAKGHNILIPAYLASLSQTFSFSSVAKVARTDNCISACSQQFPTISLLFLTGTCL